MREINIHKMFVRKSDYKRSLGRHRRRWDDTFYGNRMGSCGLDVSGLG
jgi:hypothetical protein